MNIREINLLMDANKTVDRLIDACRPRGPLCDANRDLVADVSRKAKLLRNALSKLSEEVFPAGKQSLAQRE
jgi:hypothetical protein